MFSLLVNLFFTVNLLFQTLSLPILFSLIPTLCRCPTARLPVCRRRRRCTRTCCRRASTTPTASPWRSGACTTATHVSILNNGGELIHYLLSSAHVSVVLTALLRIPLSALIKLCSHRGRHQQPPAPVGRELEHQARLRRGTKHVPAPRGEARGGPRQGGHQLSDSVSKAATI